jgi:hypothetical protein
MVEPPFPHLPTFERHGLLLEGLGRSRNLQEGLMSRNILALSLLPLMALAAPALAEDYHPEFATTPVAQPLSQRFVLIVLDQADRDLAKGDPRVNMMFDTQTGRSWILEYAQKPNSNEQGYVWVEVPYAKPPTN